MSLFLSILCLKRPVDFVISPCNIPTGSFVLSLCLSFLLVAERCIREHLAFAEHPVFAELAEKIPNYEHVWFAWELVGTHPNKYFTWLFGKEKHYPLNGFGELVLEKNASWQELCEMDSDADGITNGQELGDPCCRWHAAAGDFQISRNLEYRRWMTSHPAHPTRRNGNVHSFPKSCDEEYDAEEYQRIFRNFYFSRLEGTEDVPWSILKLAAFAFMILQIGFWIAFDGLGDDLFRSKSPMSSGQRVLLIAASFLYMDFTSGVVHLILDYAPTFLPVLGGLAGGFRYHHEDPTAICRISWFEYASHTHLLAIPILLVLRLGLPSRGLRFFWIWGLVWSHLFQSAHRWTHFPPEQLSWWKRILQTVLVLTHERHMEHHQDLEKQFTILSGLGDAVLDPLVKLVPAAHYDYWCVFGVLWFFLPNFLDSWLRPDGASSRVSVHEKV
ncbi:unnamed protein product [Durusdinium trenchii]|uniref:Temptin n=2 Tax=Durusdinium trenchii TaxID=1381693 RepID=A0ABP0SPD6_9DINO